ncbi:unnamed protein product, partial [Timema podura]|nr:unnamed protein product [Timema podura]
GTEAQRCVSRKYDQESIVCVCNATYCDLIEPTTADQLAGNVARHYISTIEVDIANATYFQVYKDVTYQQILGFGGAMTDSAAINIKSLSEEAQQNFLRAYFSPEGIEYSLVRVPMGGSDFSTHYYAYDDVVNDTNLKYFNLTQEDYLIKIPYLKLAQNLSNRQLKLFTTAWSAPDWMKNIVTMGNSTLKPEYYQLWADYYVKFLDAYAEEDLNFWAITPQNEPSHGRVFDNAFNSMGWTADQQLEWVVVNLAPTLEANGYSYLELMILDDMRSFLSEWVDTFFRNETANKLTSGVGIHWYMDSLTSTSFLDAAHEEFPDKFLLWANNTVDSPIIVNATADEFYKQPMFYALAHFSKFVPPGSVRIGLVTENNNSIENVAFLTEDDIKVIILQNNAKAKQCVARKYDQESIVCVCNATYCDLIEPTTADQLAGNVARHYISTIEEGIEYSFLRTHIGSSDFSTHYYSLDDVANDTTLEYFNLTKEDHSYLDAYAAEDIHFWGLTPQNEPDHGHLYYEGFNSMGWSAEQQLDWVVANLGPALEKNGYSELELMVLDDQRVYLANWVETVTNHWVTGWVDWNLALDLDGGPNWAKNTVDSPIIVNATADEFYKQPMFYALAHFSKFVPPGSVHIGLETENNSNSIENVAFVTEDDIKVIILQNK